MVEGIAQSSDVKSPAAHGTTICLGTWIASAEKLATRRWNGCNDRKLITRWAASVIWQVLSNILDFAVLLPETVKRRDQCLIDWPRKILQACLTGNWRSEEEKGELVVVTVEEVLFTAVTRGDFDLRWNELRRLLCLVDEDFKGAARFSHYVGFKDIWTAKWGNVLMAILLSSAYGWVVQYIPRLLHVGHSTSPIKMSFSVDSSWMLPIKHDLASK